MSGTFFVTDYCENPNAAYNTTLKRYRYTIGGRGATGLVWELPGSNDRAQKGTASCSVGGERSLDPGTLSCSGFSCPVSAAKR